MTIPYRARVDERHFLNLPGFHGGAYVQAYVEDTSERGLKYDVYCEQDCTCCPCNFEPRMILWIADCDDSISLEFDVDSEAGRVNSLHKLDTLIAALRVFRAGIVAEFEPYDRRERELAALNEQDEPGAPAVRLTRGRSSTGEHLACTEGMRVRFLSSPSPR
jgi:hypothetical protein